MSGVGPGTGRELPCGGLAKKIIWERLPGKLYRFTWEQAVGLILTNRAPPHLMILS
jgi:hypothetical protein